ncbi:MAG: hypothetical protein U0R80_02315 [Nocardioidaceae bacterium]
MNRFALPSAVAALALAGLTLVGAPAQATTLHCDRAAFPDKVELGGVSTTAYTGLEPGTTVCIKAGTQITLVEVDADGWITQDHILNPVQNNFLAISYYAYAGTGSSA